MAVVNVINKMGEKVSEIDLPDAIFGVPVKKSVLHEVVTMQLASRRAGTASALHRGEVRGSTRKLFKQKGTGRARRGDIRSPLLRGGGAVFGPRERSYAYNVPKKVRRLALKMALSAKLIDNELTIVDRIDLEQMKTREMASVMKTLNLNDVLLITDQKDERLERSSRNIPYLKILRCEGLNVYDILAYKNVILLEPAVKAIEGRLSA